MWIYQHRLQEGPSQTLAGKFFTGGERGVADLPHTAMPNQVTVQAKAGTALLFDTSIWHTSMPNLASEPRRGVIMGCRTSQTRTDGHGCGLSRQTLERLEREGKLPRVRRRLMGLPDEGLD
jgi:ectoine hydroxylase-related dioxygenase (phytanoyl-CoA dioxygenase family)